MIKIYLSTFVILSLFISSNCIAAGCTTSDSGHSGSGYQGYFKKGESTAFCRQVGNWGPNSTFLRCSITDNKTGVCTTADSNKLADPGHPNSASWDDVNNDGYIDFCRLVGDPPFQFKTCNYGPDFSEPPHKQ